MPLSLKLALWASFWILVLVAGFNIDSEALIGLAVFNIVLTGTVGDILKKE